MKTKITLILASLLLLSGCEWLKNAAEVTIETDLTTTIPVVVAGVKSADLNADLTALNFTASQTLSLAENIDVEPYLEKIREVNLKSLVVTINGLSAGQTINTISLSVTGVGTLCTQTNITSANNSFTPTVDMDLLAQAGEKLADDHQITLTLSGTASGPMTFCVSLVFDAEIVAGALD